MKYLRETPIYQTTRFEESVPVETRLAASCVLRMGSRMQRRGEPRLYRGFTCRADNNASFQRRLSSVQQTLALLFLFRTSAQTSLFRSSAATFRRSTTVMPRVNSL